MMANNENHDSSRHLSSLPEEILCRICCFLDVPTLVRVQYLNSRYRDLASRNQAGWRNHCALLWKNKRHLVPQAKNHEHSMTAYRMSLEDGTKRQDITMEELCYNVSEQCGTIWSFRFKQSAGEDWTSNDPWYNGKQERQMVFLTDNTVKRFIPFSSQDEISAAPQGNTPIFRRLQEGILVDSFSGEATAGPVMKWRFLSQQPMDLPLRQPTGSYIRLNVGGRDVPTYVVRRSPAQDWSFVMESCWGLYSSSPLPKRRRPVQPLQQGGIMPPNDGTVRPAPVVMEVASDRREDASGNSGNNGGGSHGRDRSDNNEADAAQFALADDSALVITNQVQWREALLYNFGVAVLPEGDGAAQEFDRTWGDALTQAFET